MTNQFTALLCVCFLRGRINMWELGQKTTLFLATERALPRTRLPNNKREATLPSFCALTKGEAN
jgi:hypothetical protein